jgi:hypothetical protein
VDHDDGVEGMTVARTHVLRPRRQYTGGVPGHVQAQIHKDKATCSILVRPLSKHTFMRALVAHNAAAAWCAMLLSCRPSCNRRHAAYSG